MVTVPPKLGIAGMGCRTGPYQTVAHLERAVYAGRVVGARPTSPSLLVAVDEAMRDAGCEPGQRIAVILAPGREDAAEQIVERWQLTGPCSVTAWESAIDSARRLMLQPGLEAVLIAAASPEGAGALIITRSPVYARIDALITESGGPASAEVEYLEPFTDNPVIAVIKAALCLHHAYLPDGSGPWPRPSRHSPRRAAVRLGPSSHLLLAGATSRGDLQVVDWARAEGCLVLPVTGTDLRDLVDRVGTTGEALRAGASVADLTHANLARSPGSALRAVFCAPDVAGLERELAFASKTMGAAKNEWKTPKGSYFTPAPMGPAGKVALVYPGAFNAYPGLGIDMFRYFPGLLPRLEEQTDRLADLMRHRLIYPRAARPATDTGSALLSDPAEAFAAVSYFGYAQSQIVGLLGVPVHGAFGYSLGEVSMMYASGCWAPADAHLQDRAVRAESLFEDQLSGAKLAVRTAWRIPQSVPSAEIWATHLIFAAAADLPLGRFDRVYLTQVNTPNEVIIAGDPKQCRALIETSGCDALRLPTDLVMHCPLVDETKMAASLRRATIAPPFGTELFISASYRRIDEFTDDQVADALGRSAARTVDFPRLVRTVYDHGYRFFIEVGPASSCTRWIHETLHDTPHLAESMDHRGSRTDTDVARVAARLFSHGVPVDMTALSPGR
ncbi:acyltransferase domain-containing protein [Actinoallomurus sp. NPDC050550]|uniref:acyltransferase domain-containing protein n=1 Tax=Actinoallomurus sp. NPDC050550 TaxID=3154937 RepID=UPI0033F1C276